MCHSSRPNPAVLLVNCANQLPGKDRTMRQTAVLLVLCACAELFQSVARAQAPGSPTTSGPSAPLGQNAVMGLKVKQENGAWTVEFDYFYTGLPRFAALRIDLVPQTDSHSPAESQRWRTELQSPQPGFHHVTNMLAYPEGIGSSRAVVVKLLRDLLGDQVIASQRIDKIIDWPDFQTWARDQQVALSSPA